MHNVYIIGMGPGGSGYRNPEAVETIGRCRYLTGSSRLLEEVRPYCRQDAEVLPLRQIAPCLAWIDEKQAQGDTAVLVSGDVHYYSLAGTILQSPYQWDCILIPGISSYQMMASRFGFTLEEAKLCSVHGRNESAGYVAAMAAENAKTLFLCSRDFPPQRIADALCQYGFGGFRLYIGSHLGMKEERLYDLEAEQAAGEDFSGMSVVCVCNPHPQAAGAAHFLRDEDFIRAERVPMTKEEVRILILHRLGIKPWDCLWDLGAGTGSVSIEMARQASFGRVFSVEYKERAVELIRKNKERFRCGNLEIIPDRIGACMHKLPVPDRVFLGGSEGELSSVVTYLQGLSRPVRFVMTAVTMESLAEASRLFSGMASFRYMQIQVGHSRMVGSYHTTAMNHPVWILEVDLG